MATTRKSKKVLAGVTEAEFNEAMSQYAMVSAKHGRLTSKLNEELTRVRDKYDEDLQELAKEAAAHFDVAMAYCEENKQVLFNDARSMETMYGKVGFRTGNVALKTLPKWTFEKVLARVKEMGLTDYVRVKEELDKEAILAAREDLGGKLNEMGLWTAQDEKFFITLKTEEAAEVPA